MSLLTSNQKPSRVIACFSPCATTTLTFEVFLLFKKYILQKSVSVIRYNNLVDRLLKATSTWVILKASTCVYLNNQKHKVSSSGERVLVNTGRSYSIRYDRSSLPDRITVFPRSYAYKKRWAFIIIKHNTASGNMAARCCRSSRSANSSRDVTSQDGRRTGRGAPLPSSSRIQRAS